MPTKSTQHYLRYDPERTDYTITEAELEILERGNAPLWKDVFLVALPLAASTLFNAYGEGNAQAGETLKLTVPIFLNTVIGFVGVGFAIMAGVAWFRSKTSFKAVIERIKNKPRYLVPAGTFATKEDAEQEADPQRPAKKRKAKPAHGSEVELAKEGVAPVSPVPELADVAERTKTPIKAEQVPPTGEQQLEGDQ